MREMLAITTAAVMVLISTSALGAVTVTAPGNAARVLRGTVSITNNAKDPEGRVCTGCHDLHNKEKTNRQFVGVELAQNSKKSNCTYKKKTALSK